MKRKFKAIYQLKENGSFFQETIESNVTEFIDAVSNVVSRIRIASPEAINISVELI